MPVCQGCDVSFDESFAFCPYCGRAKPEPPKINMEVVLKQESSPDDCPKCKNNLRTQKVSSIVFAGTSLGYGKAHSVGNTEFISRDGRRVGEGFSSGTATMESVNQNLLAKKLKAPNKPEREKIDLTGIWILLLSIILLWVGFATDAPPICIGTFILLFVFSIFLLIMEFAGHTNEEMFQKKITTYKKAMFIWNRLYYCHKHDIVFMEGREEHFPVERTLEACTTLANKLNLIIKADVK